MSSLYLVIKALLLPPLNLFVLATVGWLLSYRWLHIGHAVIGTGVILLYLLLTPYVSSELLRSLQRYPALTAASLTKDAGAIVVLGGDVYRQALEYDHHAVGPLTLVRLQYGAWLYRRLQLPILVTGGKQRGTERSLAELMRETLVHDFRLPVRWVEPASRNTYENAKFSAKILKMAGIRKIYLVTHAWHMPRAKACFEALDSHD
jgi:uncharacterized SAM-binding protein YcdF (DUF218 family)